MKNGIVKHSDGGKSRFFASFPGDFFVHFEACVDYLPTFTVWSKISIK